MKVRTSLTGTAPLVQHNIQMADPDNRFKRAIDEITSKKKSMTVQDLAEKERLQFLGSLYMGKEGVVVPAANIRRCFQEAAKVRRLGRDITRALIPQVMEIPLIFDGPSDPAKLWANPVFHYRTMVGIQRSRVASMRPWFPRWSLICDWELVEETLDFDALELIVREAGIIEGLGDNRINGMGRFDGVTEKL